VAGGTATWIGVLSGFVSTAAGSTIFAAPGTAPDPEASAGSGSAIFGWFLA
jgi:hypothetical protein